MSLPADNFGRTITMSTVNGQDVYTVDDGDGNMFTISYPTGTDVNSVYSVINSMPVTAQPSQLSAGIDQPTTLGDVLGVLGSYSLIPIDGTIVTQDLVDHANDQLQAVSATASVQNVSPEPPVLAKT